MKPYFKGLWRTKRSYITSFFAILLFVGYQAVSHPKPFNSADWGLGVGTALFFLLFAGPIVFIKVNRIKIKHPKPVFVEPPLWKLGLMVILTDAVIIGAITALFTIDQPLGDAFNKILDADGFLSGIIMMPLILTLAFGALLVYGIVIEVRYKNIIQYNSAEWRRRRQRR